MRFKSIARKTKHQPRTTHLQHLTHRQHLSKSVRIVQPNCVRIQSTHCAEFPLLHTGSNQMTGLEQR